MIVVIDTYTDVFVKKKKYPYPMELVGEWPEYIEVKQGDQVIRVFRKEIKQIHRIGKKRVLRKVK